MRTMRRLLLALACCAALPAAAQESAAPIPKVRPPRPPGLLSASPQGTASLGSSRDDDELENPFSVDFRGVTVPQVEADQALFRGLLWAFEPAPREVRVLAIEDLGLLGDPRALNSLAHLVIDPDPAFQLAALKAIRAIRSPRSEEILMNVVRHPTMPERAKLFALTALLYQNTAAALWFIYEVARNPAWGQSLNGTARTLMQELPRRQAGTPT